MASTVPSESAKASTQAHRHFSSTSDSEAARHLGTARASDSGTQRYRKPRKYPCFWTDLGETFSRSVGKGGTAPASKNPVSKVALRLAKLCRRVIKNTWGAIKNPMVIWAWTVDIWDITKNIAKWFVTGMRLFRKNIGVSSHLAKRVAFGHALSIRERQLLTKTTVDCLRIVPFSLFVIIPFAELLLPVALRFFPGLMPSTFFKDKYDDSTLARKLQAKQQMAGFWQEVVQQRSQAILEAENHEHADKAGELQAFQEMLMSGKDFPSVKQIQRFSKLFQEEMKLAAMSNQQLGAMSKMLGLKPMTLPIHNQLQLRHHITSLRREDRDYLWEGIEGLTKPELIEACKKRAIRFHGVTETDMRRELDRWLDISRHKKIPTSLLLWIQSFSLTSEETASGFKAPETPEPKDFQVKVEAPPEVEAEPKDAFDGMEQRQKVRLQDAQTRLEELEHEIEEVMAEEDKAVDVKESTKPVSENTAMELEQEEKQSILKRIDELSKAHEVNRTIIDRQREMLLHQLEFMSHMRDNAPEHSQDAGRILFDQRVRLVEGMNTFKKDMEEIEALLNQADAIENVSFHEGDLDWISELFNQLDMNKDGVISRREFEKAARGLAVDPGSPAKQQTERLADVARSEALSHAAAGGVGVEAAPGKMVNGSAKVNGKATHESGNDYGNDIRKKLSSLSAP